MELKDFFKIGCKYKVLQEFCDYSGAMFQPGAELTFMKFSYAPQGDGCILAFREATVRLGPIVNADVLLRFEDYFEIKGNLTSDRFEFIAFSAARLFLDSHRNGFFNVEVRSAQGKTWYLGYDEWTKSAIDLDISALLWEGSNFFKITYGPFPDAHWAKGEAEFRVTLHSPTGKLMIDQRLFTVLSGDKYVAIGTRPFEFAFEVVLK